MEFREFHWNAEQEGPYMVFFYLFEIMKFYSVFFYKDCFAINDHPSMQSFFFRNLVG